MTLAVEWAGPERLGNVRMTMMQQRQRSLYYNGRRPSTVLGGDYESSRARQRGREQKQEAARQRGLRGPALLSDEGAPCIKLGIFLFDERSALSIRATNSRREAPAHPARKRKRSGFTGCG